MHTMDGTPQGGFGQDLEALISYARLRTLLLAALSRLAERGYAIPPDDALDLVHDFYLESGRGLADRYDPSRAKFETYLFAAFVRFARPRIVRLGRMRSLLMPPTEVHALSDGRTAFEPGIDEAPDLDATRRALRALPPGDRALLAGYLDEAQPSERDLAATFGLTRYQLRTRLVDVLGAVAVRLGAAHGFPEPDRAIAEALWANKCSSREAAGLLRLPTSEIQAARRRMFARLVHATRGTRNMSRSHHAHRSETPRPDPIAALVAAALRRGADDRVLAAVRDRREAVLSYIESVDPALTAKLYEGANPADLAAFYAALASDVAGEDEDEWSISHARNDDERAIGEAFAQTLLPDLPERLLQFDHFFVGPWILAPDAYAAVVETASVVAGGTEAAALARHGVTPVVLAEATQALSGLFGQIASEQGVSVGGDLLVRWREGTATGFRPATVDRSAMTRDLLLSLALPEVTCERLLDWLMEVAGYRPLLIDGYEVTPDGDALRLRRTDAFEGDLFERWRPGT